MAKGEVLLVKDWLGSGDWKLPGGGLHKNEDHKAGLLRELKEETGLVLKPSQIKYLLSFRSNSNRIPSHIIAFSATLKTKPDVWLSAEMADYVWVKPADLAAWRLSPTTQTILGSWLPTQDFAKMKSGKRRVTV